MIAHLSSHVRNISAETTYNLRQEILRPGRPQASCQFPNDQGQGTQHFGAYRNDNLVGILSVYHLPLSDEFKSWQLRAMATAPWVRGMGYGMDLLLAAEKNIIQESGKIIWCNARLHAIGFYEKAGFKTCGEKFYIPRVGEHYLMKKQLFV